MSKYTNLPKAKVKQKDELFSRMDFFVFQVAKYKNPLLALTGLIVVSLMIFGIYGAMAEKGKKKMAESAYLAKKQDDPIAALGKLLDKAGPQTWLLQLDVIEKKRAKNDDTHVDALIQLDDWPESLEPFAVYSRAQAYWQKGQDQEALKLIDTYKGDSFLENIKLLKAEILSTTGKVKEAEEIFKSLTETSEDMAIKKRAREYMLLKSQNLSAQK